MITYINPDAIEDQSIDWSKLKNVPEFPLTTINVTYGELKALRDSAELTVGQQYRITDYVTTTSQENTTSAGHQFDIIVTADSESTLNEKARACLHEDDTYFADSDLNAWEIWYCLDNDTERFAWANSSEEDEDVVSGVSTTPIVINSSNFSNTSITSSGQTFTFDKPISHIFWNGNTYKLSQMQGITGVQVSQVLPVCVRANSPTKLLVFSTSTVSTSYLDTYPIEVYTEEYTTRYAGKGVIYRMIDERGNDCSYDFKNIMFKHPDSNKITTYPDYYYTFTVRASGVVTDYSLNSHCYNNVMKERITLTTPGKFGILLNNNIFINSTTTFYCYNNSIGNDCANNSFEDNCCSNSFGNNCGDNSFGNNCGDNSFGNNCRNNTFNGDCYRNSFGNDCVHNSFGNGCYDNSFGNDCMYNILGDNCDYNSFDDDCDYNSFRLSASSTATILNNCRYNHFDNGCEYVIIWNSTQPTNTSWLKNIKVDKSASSTSSSYVYYNVSTLNSSKPIFISKEYNTTIATSSIPIGLYNTSTAINNKVYTANVTVTPNKSCINAAGGFYETSDERLKNFSDDVMIDLEKLSSLRKKYFTWKDGHGDQQLGVSAQEVQVLYPELVNEGDDGNLSVDYAKLSVVALSAVDKLYNKQKDLEDKLAKIEKALNL